MCDYCFFLSYDLVQITVKNMENQDDETQLEGLGWLCTCAVCAFKSRWKILFSNGQSTLSKGFVYAFHGLE